MYNANYMEGVPVKIAEKYKPPPQIYKLPQSLVNKLNLPENFYETSTQFQYDMQLEHKALSKITEWKRIRQRNSSARKERKELKELQRKKDDEQKQRNLLCSVSYPSADDLSSTESEEGEQAVEQEKSIKSNNLTGVAADSMSTPQAGGHADTPNSFHNILQPTVLSSFSRSSTSTATSQNVISNSINGLITTNSVKTSSLNAFNYKDFEDDTSSPFDNIELKTINDLDVLAQVLHNSQIKTNANDTKTEEKQCEPEATDSEATALENANEITLSHEEIIPKHSNLPKLSYDLENLNSAQEAQYKLSSYAAGHVLTNANFSPLSHHQTFIGQQHPHEYLQYQQEGILNINSDYHNNMHVLQMNKNNHHVLEKIQNDGSSKSKSVPDILKELREEIRNSELRRTRNCSQNLENGIHSDFCMEESSTEAEIVEDTFSILDSKSRQLAEQICGMGFPKERVARIVQLLGADDKKIIEHLIPLSELADLGFDECKISEALMRHENNKNKALDDLIS